MAAREINLIQEQKTFSPAREQLVATIYKWLTPVLVVFVLVLAATFGSSLYLKLQLNQVSQQIGAEKSRIQALEKDESRYLLLKQKAGAITSILNSQFPYADFFSFLKSLASEQMTISSIDVDDSGSITLAATVKDSETLDALTKTLIVEAEKRFREVELTSVQYDEQHNLIIQLQFVSQAKT